MYDDFGADFEMEMAFEGSDIDNWEDEMVFRDNEGADEVESVEAPASPYKCSCGEPAYTQHDHYGIYAGKSCDECFEKNFKQGPYFDPGYAGESLEEDW